LGAWGLFGTCDWRTNQHGQFHESSSQFGTNDDLWLIKNIPSLKPEKIIVFFFRLDSGTPWSPNLGLKLLFWVCFFLIWSGNTCQTFVHFAVWMVPHCRNKTKKN
jgi:hypothetical protein